MRVRRSPPAIMHSAIAELRQLVAQTPGNASMSLQLISALQRSGDNAGALAAARTASQSFRRNPEVLTRCADLILATGGNKAEAKVCLKPPSGNNQTIRLAQSWPASSWKQVATGQKRSALLNVSAV